MEPWRRAQRRAPPRVPKRKRICNLVPTPTERTPDGLAIRRCTRGGGGGHARALPASLDLRKAWWDIGDQGSTGSCVGWGSTDGVARQMFVTANRLTQTTHLSPRFTWMACKETDPFTSRPQTMIEEAGTTLKTAVDVLRKYGAVPETMLPFKINTTMYTGNENTFYATAATRKIASYFNLQRNLANWRSCRWGSTGRSLRRPERRRNVGRRDRDRRQAGHLQARHGARRARGGGGRIHPGQAVHRAQQLGAPPGATRASPTRARPYINAAFYDESYGVVL